MLSGKLLIPALVAAVALSQPAQALNPQPIPPGRAAQVALNPHPIPPGRVPAVRFSATVPAPAPVIRSASPQIDPPPVLRRARGYRGRYAGFAPQIDPAPR